MPQPTAIADSRIMLHSGRLFDLANPSSAEIAIDDIAHGLAHTCRFAGQCDGFYSVAEHSVLVSQVVSVSTLAALFHDAAEAFIGDMSRPLKQLLPEYAQIEKRIQLIIFASLRIEWPPPPEVKVADLSVLAAEQRVLMPPGTNEWLRLANVTPASVIIRRLNPVQAKQAFLDRYGALAAAH